MLPMFTTAHIKDQNKLSEETKYVVSKLARLILTCNQKLKVVEI